MLKAINYLLLLFSLILPLHVKGQETLQAVSSGQISEIHLNQANEWLDVLMRFLGPQSEMSLSVNQSLMTIIGDIPNPETWPAIILGLEEKLTASSWTHEDPRRYIVNIFIAILKEDLNRVITQTEKYLDNLRKSDFEGHTDYLIEEVESHLNEIYLASGDPVLTRKTLDEWVKQLKGDEKGFAGFLLEIYHKFFSSRLEEDVEPILLPDILSIFGEDEARKWVDNALQQKWIQLTSNSTSVKSFLKDRVIELKSAVATPQWQLVDGVGDKNIKLYEAIKQYFPDSNYYQAEAYYIFSLVVDGQIDKAYRRVEDGFNLAAVNKKVYSSLIKGGRAKEVYKLLSKFINDNPQTVLIDAFIEAGIAAGRQAEVIENLQALRNKSGISKQDKLWININYVKAKFAGGLEESRTELLQELISSLGSIDNIPKELHDDVYKLAINFMQGGSLFDDQSFYKSAKTLARMVLNEYRNIEKVKIEKEFIDRDYYSDNIRVMAFISQLIRNKEYTEAKERLLVLVESQANDAKDSFLFRNEMFAGELLQVYTRLGDYKAALNLLDQHPDWEWKQDVADLVSIELDNKEYLGIVIADVFSQLGKLDDAKKVLRKLMYEKPGYDPAYHKYLSLAGPDNAIIEFENIFKFDAFEERPLIWTAQAYMILNEYDKAMKYLNKAVSIDPSDGEQGKGRRMHVYELMGKVHLQKGEMEKAQFFQDVVTSIRISELADEFYEAGFTKKSLIMYEEALSYFSDAYCIQSRLAVRQASFGMEDSALSHYQRAYELMPNSFGRMETHCLACSSVFERDDAQALAEKVFNELMSANPAKPQSWYLMGYLKKTQNDFSSAKVFYEKAVSIDPDYINAWKQLKLIKDDIVLLPAEYDDIAINLMRLDPMQRHFYLGVHKIQKVSRLWHDLKLNHALEFPKFDDIYTLKAAQKEMKTLPEDKSVFLEYKENDHRILRPGELLSMHKTFFMLSYLLVPTNWD